MLLVRWWWPSRWRGGESDGKQVPHPRFARVRNDRLRLENSLRRLGAVESAGVLRLRLVFALEAQRPILAQDDNLVRGLLRVGL